MLDKNVDAHDGCCYRKDCEKDIEKCCYMKTKNKKCLIGGCKEWEF